jgi:hypothetical protein
VRERERKKGRRRERERERKRGKREREVKGIERECERESKILVKYPKPINKAQTKVDYTKLSLAMISRNYQLVNYYTKLSREIIS